MYERAIAFIALVVCATTPPPLTEDRAVVWRTLQRDRGYGACVTEIKQPTSFASDGIEGRRHLEPQRR